MRLLLFTVVLALLAAGGVWASASGDGRLRLPGSERGTATQADRAERAGDRARRAERAGRRRARAERRRRGLRVRASRCPVGLAGCAAARGRVLYVEAVDPDGDGDLHVVLAGGGVTGPGLTAVDVEPALRPARDPRPGDLASAAGQVQRGSYGQDQIHAVEFHTRRAR